MAEERPLVLGELIEALDSVPPQLPLLFDHGGCPNDLWSRPEGRELLVLLWWEQHESGIPVKDVGEALTAGRWVEILRDLLVGPPTFGRHRTRTHMSLPAEAQVGTNSNLHVTGVRVDSEKAALVLGDSEDRYPRCQDCGFVGPMGPGQLTLGQLIEKLERFPVGSPIRCDLGQPPKELGADRRHHHHLAIYHRPDHQIYGGYSTVAALVTDLRSAVGKRFDSGFAYLLGTRIYDFSPVWAHGGWDVTQGQTVVDAVQQDGDVVLVTSVHQWDGRNA